MYVPNRWKMFFFVCFSLFLALVSSSPLDPRAEHTNVFLHLYSQNCPTLVQLLPTSKQKTPENRTSEIFLVPGACLSEILPTDKSNFVDGAEKPWKIFMISLLTFLEKFFRKMFARCNLKRLNNWKQRNLVLIFNLILKSCYEICILSQTLIFTKITA